MKTIENHFADWEAHVFGFGYGTGEEYVLPALKRFLSLCDRGKDKHAYDYTILEENMDPCIVWLFINILAKHGVDIIEYGTSPRYAWLTDEGKRLKDFCLSKTDDELYDITAGADGEEPDEQYIHCAPDYCNCEGDECHNPFWVEPKVRERATYDIVES